MSKLILSIWLLALSCLTTMALPTGFAGIPVCAVHCLQLVRVFSFDYDRRIQAHINYDGSSKGIFDYDGAEVRSATECARQSVSSLTLVAKFANFLAAEGGTATAYRAINPAFADATEASGQFYRSGLPGRLGNDGIYANSTVEGAIAEFNAHNAGITPTVFKVQYPVSPTLNISPPSGYFGTPLPFTGDANVFTAPSLRAPGTMNFLIREGAVPAGRVS